MKRVEEGVFASAAGRNLLRIMILEEPFLKCGVDKHPLLPRR